VPTAKIFSRYPFTVFPPEHSIEIERKKVTTFPLSDGSVHAGEELGILRLDGFAKSYGNPSREP
jgi:hypothetical protein